MRRQDTRPSIYCSTGSDDRLLIIDFLTSIELHNRANLIPALRVGSARRGRALGVDSWPGPPAYISIVVPACWV